MSLSGYYQVLLVGFLGGIILELMHWYSLRRKPLFPDYARSLRYWVVTAAMAITGGILAVIYFGDRGDAIVILHVGLSAPLILQKLTTTLAFTPGAKGGRANIHDFLAW